MTDNIIYIILFVLVLIVCVLLYKYNKQKNSYEIQIHELNNIIQQFKNQNNGRVPLNIPENVPLNPKDDNIENLNNFQKEGINRMITTMNFL